MMVTLEQITVAHGKVKSGKDFPAYIEEIKKLGVQSYITFVEDGHTSFDIAGQQQLVSGAKYAVQAISKDTDAEKFKQQLKLHQQGGTDYFTFCKQCAENGIEQWEVDSYAMICTYFSKAGAKVLVEVIPG